jgi:hypothetical protein
MRAVVGRSTYAAAARRSAGVLAAALLCLQGCSASTTTVQSTAERFEEAVSESDWAGACALLAPKTLEELEKSAGKQCGAALAEEELPAAGSVDGVAAYSTSAQVRFDQDTVFLAEFPKGWRVVAAGCAPDPGRPYDCRLQGG